jgi:hypothetical protein
MRWSECCLAHALLAAGSRDKSLTGGNRIAAVTILSIFRSHFFKFMLYARTRVAVLWSQLPPDTL